MVNSNRNANADLNLANCGTDWSYISDTVNFAPSSNTINFVSSVVVDTSRTIATTNLHSISNFVVQCDSSIDSIVVAPTSKGFMNYNIASTSNLTAHEPVAIAINTNLDEGFKGLNIAAGGGGGTLIIQKQPDVPCHLILPSNTKINIKLGISQNDNNRYFFENSSSEELVIKNITSFINTCVFLNNLNTCTSLNTDLPYPEPIEIKLDEVTYLRSYEKIDKKLIGLFAKQNNMNIDLKKVDLFIKKNFFELSGIAHTNSTIFPQEILEEFCLYLNLSDINLNPADNHVPLLADSYDILE